MYLKLSVANIVDSVKSINSRCEERCNCSAYEYCGKVISEYKLCHYDKNVLPELDKYLTKVESMDPEVAHNEWNTLMKIHSIMAEDTDNMETLIEPIARVKRLIDNINNYNK